jgi:hypothetical protein
MAVQSWSVQDRQRSRGLVSDGNDRSRDRLRGAWTGNLSISALAHSSVEPHLPPAWLFRMHPVPVESWLDSQSTLVSEPSLVHRLIM